MSPSRRTSRNLTKVSVCGGIPVLEVVLDDGHELIRHRAVNQPVVIAERQVGHRSNGDGIVDHNWTLFNRTHTENRDLRLIDDRHAEQRTKDTGIGNREGAASHFIRLHLLRSSASSQVRDGSAEAEQVLLVSLLYDGDDQAPIESHSDSGIDGAMV